MRNTDSKNRLASLSAALREAAIDIYLVPMVDAFQSEYIPDCAARLPFLTGFTGSAGMGAFWAIPHAEKRHTLFVDGRYILQAPQEVDADTVAVLNSGQVSLAAWLKEHADTGQRVAVDPWLVTAQQWQRWQEATQAQHLEWVLHPQNMVDVIWENRPKEPASMLRLQPVEQAGASYPEKSAPMLALLAERGWDGFLFTQPDAINWLLNIRGEDIPFNPLVLSYFVLLKDGTSILFLNERPFLDGAAAYLAEHRVTCVDIHTLFAGELPDALKGITLAADMASTPQGWLQLAAEHNTRLVACEDPVALPKACKNVVEMQGMRAAHWADGLAVCRFLHWLDAQLEAKHYPTELDVVARLEQFRAMATDYRGASFATIAGSGPHGAIVHYRADASSNRRLRAGELLLLDSGGQYAGGTTDITRTLTVGKPSAAMCEHFTRVLKGHIAIASAQFPAGTNGGQLDILARQHLWSVGLDYDHGTGHGVGAYLCVHEGPQRISKRGSAVALQPGMVVSNEPGYYAAGAYGIRIESLVHVVPVGAMEDGSPRLGFETLTLAPIDARLIDVALLSATERNWLNHYHQQVYKAYEQQLEASQRDWLAQATRAI